MNCNSTWDLLRSLPRGLLLLFPVLVLAISFQFSVSFNSSTQHVATAAHWMSMTSYSSAQLLGLHQIGTERGQDTVCRYISMLIGYSPTVWILVWWYPNYLVVKISPLELTKELLFGSTLVQNLLLVTLSLQSLPDPASVPWIIVIPLATIEVQYLTSKSEQIEAKSVQKWKTKGKSVTLPPFLTLVSAFLPLLYFNTCLTCLALFYSSLYLFTPTHSHLHTIKYERNHSHRNHAHDARTPKNLWYPT